MRESLLLIVFPATGLILGVEDLGMVELLGLDLGKVRVHLEVPVLEDARLREGLDQISDAVVPTSGVSDHIIAQLAHLVAILSEVGGKASLMAAGRNEIDLLTALTQHKQGLVKLLHSQFDLPSLL